MVKITKSGYTPIVDSSSKSQLEGRIDQASSQASGLVDATLRNVSQTQNQAARDKAVADQTAFNARIGLSNTYFSTQQKYLESSKILFNIDAQNQANMEKQVADSWNLAAKEKISLATDQFYAEAKAKNPGTLLEDTQAFINSQIEEAVKVAPNDKAVLDLNAEMSKFKITRLGKAVEDRQEFRNKQITEGIIQAQQAGSANIRLNPSVETFVSQLDNFTQIGNVLKGQGYSKDQIAGFRDMYNQEMSASLIDGYLDNSDVDAAKKLFTDQSFVEALGNKFNSKLDETKKREQEVLKLRKEQAKEATILYTYHSGKTPEGIKGASEIVYADNLRFLKEIESKLTPDNVTEGSARMAEYIKQRPEFLPTETVNYMANAVLGSTNMEAAAAYANTFRELVNGANTAHLFKNLDKDTMAQVAIISDSVYQGIPIDKAVTDVRDTYGKVAKLGGKEEISKSVSTALTDKFGKADAVTIGKKIWNDLDDSRYTMPLWERIGEQLNFITPQEPQLRELGLLYTESFNREFVNTGDTRKAHVAAQAIVKASQAVTTVNGKLEIMMKSPEQLGILNTEEGKSYFNYELDRVKKEVATKLGGTLVNGKVRVADQEKNINIAPIPFQTGFEQDDTVRYLLVDDNQSPIRINGREQYLTLDKRTYMKVIEDRALAQLKTEQAMRDNLDKTFDKLRQDFDKKYGKK